MTFLKSDLPIGYELGRVTMYLVAYCQGDLVAIQMYTPGTLQASCAIKLQCRGRDFMVCAAVV